MPVGPRNMNTSASAVTTRKTGHHSGEVKICTASAHSALGRHSTVTPTKAAKTALMSTAPAEILGLAGHGRVLPGYAADLTLVELDTPYTVDKNALHSTRRNCPYDGAQRFGRVDLTLKGGKITWKR